METIVNMFVTFVAFCGGVILITETINRVFKVKDTTAKLIVSWTVSLVLACLGFGFQLGFFASCGDINQWKGWVKALIIGLGCAICSNRTYDMNEVWRFIQIIFSLFSKDDKISRQRLNINK